MPTGALTYAGKVVQDASADTSWTTTERGWDIPSLPSVLRAETLSCTWTSEANGGTAVAKPPRRAAGAVREHRDLFLRGEDQIDFFLFRHREQMVEPDHGSRAEHGDRQEGMDVTGEPCEAHGVGHGDGNVVSHAVQLGRHLT